jgi:hypothetical protein
METNYENQTENEFTGRTYTITLDPTPQHTKPKKDKRTMGTISNRINLATGLTINEFATYVSQPYGYTWFGGTLNGSICNEAWNGQSVFAIDFDKGKISVDDAIKRLEKVELDPQLWYTSLSSYEELHKFRIVLFVEEPVRELGHRNRIVNGLLALFPEADKKCKNAGRFFFGGRESNILSQRPIPTQKLLDISSIVSIVKDHGKTRKIQAELDFVPSTKNVSKCASLYYNNRSMQFQTNPHTTTTYLSGGRLEIIDWELAPQRVKILEAFVNGEWLYHDQLFGLATNLFYINGGRKLMKDTMEKYNALGVTHYDDNNFAILTYLKVEQYPPQPIHSFSDYDEDEDLYDLISAVKYKRGLIEILEPMKKIPLIEAEEKFKLKFDEIMNDPCRDRIHLFVLATAIGKTENITSLAGVTIAAPTNDLKNEIAERMKVEKVTTPDSVEFDNQGLHRKVKGWYSMGLYHKATSVLHEVINKKNELRYSKNDIDRASSYLKQLAESYQSKHTVLTTHSRALHSEFSHDTIIFDEDPLKSLIDIKQLRITDFVILNHQTNLQTTELIDLIHHLDSSTPGEINNTPDLIKDIEALIERVTLPNIDTNLFEFFKSTFFIKDSFDPDLIHYVVKRELPSNKKIIILSATLPIFIYQKLFGDKLNIIDIRDVEQQGQIIQYTKKSCSRSSLKRYGHKLGEIVGDKPVITFKTLVHLFKTPVKGMHFGNCSGYDSMKGIDMAVVGTPHRNNIEYFLTAKVLGIEFMTTDSTMKYQKTDYNGFRFMFNCFDNADLRSIQLDLIESDLLQAIGRARTLRTDATVEVFSNFPLRISNKFVKD